MAAKFKGRVDMNIYSKALRLLDYEVKCTNLAMSASPNVHAKLVANALL